MAATHLHLPGEQVEIGKIAIAVRLEVLVAQVAAAGDGNRAVGNPQLVVHAPVEARRIGKEFQQPGETRAAPLHEGIEHPHLDAGLAHGLCGWQ